MTAGGIALHNEQETCYNGPLMVQDPLTTKTAVPGSGDIKALTIPWLFQALRVQNRTGTAVFSYVQGQTGDKIEKKVYFKSGDITFAASSLPSDRLGDMLLRTGKLTQAQFDASTELIKSTGKKQGAILVQLGFITPQGLVDSVKEHVKQIILALFAIRMGSYRFDEGPLPMADIIPLQMSTGNVILDGVTALEWNDLRRMLPSPTSVIRPATDPSCLFQDAHLTADQQTVFSLIDGKRSIEEICGLAGVGDFNAMKAVYVLLALRMAEEGQLKTEEEMQFAREAVQEAVRPKAAQPAAPAGPAEPALVVTKDSILAAFAALPNQDHYQLLGVERTATMQQIKKAYFRLAKAYHPDRHFDPAMADLKDKLDALFDHIHKAYESLSNQATRAEYELELARRKAAAQQQPAAAGFEEKHAEEYVENYADKAARAVEQFNNGMKDFKMGNFWGAVEAFSWAFRLDPLKAPYVFYLGICLTNIPRRKHEAEEYLQKAVELDPTKAEYHQELSNLYLRSGLKSKAIGVLNAALNHLPASQKITEAISLAEEGKTSAVISGNVGPKPAAAGRTAGAPKEDKAKTSQAQQEYAAAMKEFRVGNYGVAVDGFGAAIRLDPSKAEHFFYHGLCLTRIARRQEEAEESLKKALELDTAKVDHHVELGNFYLRTGHKAKALGIFTNALLRFPSAPKVRDGVKAAGGAVAEGPAEDKKGGMFSKLFKK
jgi:tetratricopeptide (TPR) repeat protein